MATWTRVRSHALSATSESTTIFFAWVAPADGAAGDRLKRDGIARRVQRLASVVEGLIERAGFHVLIRRRTVVDDEGSRSCLRTTRERRALPTTGSRFACLKRASGGDARR
jgi:hypothetical protein